MKTLITLLLLASVSTQAQTKWYKIPSDTPTSLRIEISPSPFNQYSNKKWFSISKNDLWVMGMEVGAGYSQGWREEVLYHPNALFKHFPDLSPKFWDARWSWQNGDAYKWDANHVLKGTTMAFHLAAVCIKVGDIKNYPKKQRWKKILFDAAKYYISYQVGFALSYNITHGNKFF